MRRLPRLALIFSVVVLGGATTVGAEEPVARTPASQPASAPAKDYAALERQLQELQAEQAAMRREIMPLQQQVAETTSPEQREPRFSLSGFIDTSFRTWQVYERGAMVDLYKAPPSFVFGRVNTYFDYRPGASWRVLTELGLLVAPVGDVVQSGIPAAGVPFKRTANYTTLYGSSSEVVQWNSIRIERAQIEYAPFDWLSARVGLFLTPYGIWNIDHGSPTQLTAFRPYLYNFRMFPEQQLGINLYGRLARGGLALDYDLTLSNGRGPVNTHIDSNADKAVGGRVALGSAGRTRWKLGFSFYTGSFTDYEVNMFLSPALDIVRRDTVRYRETALEADLSLHVGPVSLDWETLANWRKYEDAYRPYHGYYVMTWNPTLAPPPEFSLGALEADFVTWGTSATLSYQLPLKLRIRPYFRFGYADNNSNIKVDGTAALCGGINWRITAAVVLKAEYERLIWTQRDRTKPVQMFLDNSPDAATFTTQLAVAF